MCGVNSHNFLWQPIQIATYFTVFLFLFGFAGLLSLFFTGEAAAAPSAQGLYVAAL
jgi:hypothetical protein